VLHCLTKASKCTGMVGTATTSYSYCSPLQRAVWHEWLWESTPSAKYCADVCSAGLHRSFELKRMSLTSIRRMFKTSQLAYFAPKKQRVSLILFEICPSHCICHLLYSTCNERQILLHNECPKSSNCITSHPKAQRTPSISADGVVSSIALKKPTNAFDVGTSTLQIRSTFAHLESI
jgi:hypothetical protein